MRRAFKDIQAAIIRECEAIPRVKAPLPEYLEALEEISGEVEAWFEASIEATRDDIRRQGGEP